MYNGKLNENCLSTRVCSYKNLKPKPSMQLPPDPDSLVDRLKCVHLKCYFWLNALKVTLPLLNIGSYGWKMRGNYNGLPM